jgi:hypothetical protein
MTTDTPETVPQADEPTFQYSAFISYSHKDAAFASWLHKRLEAFRFPAYDGRVLTKNRKFPLSPAFRDLEELAASGDLGESIRRALDGAHALVILCSPSAAASPWVNKEISHFLSLGRHEHILPVLVEGEPVYGGEGAPANAAFPPALKDDPTENLWIDARGLESKDRVFARIAAGLLGVTFDQVWKRKQRAERMRAITTTAAAILIGLPLLTFGWTAAQPIRMADCPIDRLVFSNGWQKNSDTGEKMVVQRVGRAEYGMCEGKEVKWDAKAATGMDCRGPYGETVFSGTFYGSDPHNSAELKQIAITSVYPTYHIEPGAPCCWWNVKTTETADEIFKDERFAWYKPGEAPALAEMPFNEIQLDNDVSTDDWEGFPKLLTASECNVDLVGRMGMAGKRVMGWFQNTGGDALTDDAAG